jgi:hypothetical protein
MIFKNKLNQVIITVVVGQKDLLDLRATLAQRHLFGIFPLVDFLAICFVFVMKMSEVKKGEKIHSKANYHNSFFRIKG